MRLILAALALAWSLPAQTNQIPACQADGAVTNALDGMPLQHARVNLEWDGGRVTATANAEGFWELAGVPCGLIQISVSHPGFLDLYQQEVAGLSLRKYRIALRPQSVLFGRVVDESGDPVPGARIVAYESLVVRGTRAMRDVRRTFTNDLGEYRLAGLEPDRYVLCARGAGVLLDSRSRTIFGSSCYPNPLEAEPALTIRLALASSMAVGFTLPEIPAAQIRGNLTGMPPGSDAEL